MNGLTNEQEAALAFLMMHRNEGVPNFDDNVRPTAPFIALRDAGMITMQTDWNQTLVVFQGLTAAGVEHYQQVRYARRHFVTLNDTADELIAIIVANADLKKSRGNGVLFEEDDGRVEDFRELRQNGLLDVQWVDNKAYFYTPTSKARFYVEGTFPEQEDKVQIINNNNVNVNSESNAQASATSIVTLSATVAAILDLDIDNETKEAAESAVKELDKAAKNKDATTFTEKLEKVASIAKSTATLANAILPYVPNAIQTLLS